MVHVPGGVLERGDATDCGYADERPVRRMQVSGLLVDRTEVTWSRWHDVFRWATDHGYIFDAAYDWHPGRGASHPVCEISWFDAVRWCNARSEKEGLTPVYRSGAGDVFREGQPALTAAMVRWGANGYRLPTEAEWEWAARGGLQGQNYSWPSPGTNLAAQIDGTRANYWQSGDLWETDTDCATAPVGRTSQPNGYGLLDMTGNVSEWCWDWYLDGWYADPGSAEPDSRGPAEGYGRVLRGGSWISSLKYCRVSARYMSAPDYRCHCYGFRCVRLRP